MHIDNENKDILILGEGPTQELDDATLTAEAKYPVNFKQTGFVLSLHNNRSNSFLFVNTTKINQLKYKIKYNWNAIETLKHKIMHCV